MSSFKALSLLVVLLIATFVSVSACTCNDGSNNCDCNSTGSEIAGWIIFLIILGAIICCCLAICGGHTGYHYQRYNTLPPYWGYMNRGAVVNTGPAYAAPATAVVV